MKEDMATDCRRVSLLPEEISTIDSILAELRSRYGSVEALGFQANAPLLAQEFPRRLRKAFHDFKLRETSSVLIVSGFPIDQEAIGKTPEHWKNKTDRPAAVIESEIFLTLFGWLLGDPIAWSTQQDGHLVHDIFPIAGHQKEQLGTGSEEDLTWHTEDAFHSYRGDYICMLCLRNADQIPTTIGTLNGLAIPPEQLRILFERRFTIRPDESHLAKNKSGDRPLDPALQDAYDRINQMNTEPEKIAVFFGSPSSPYLRLDPYFMDPLVDDPEAEAALGVLVDKIDHRLADMVLEAGDVCFIDNFRAVHGRKAFKARYDGTDRWLKRINVTRDLRKSRDARATADSQVIL